MARNWTTFDKRASPSTDEAFVTGTFGGITPVVEVDGRKIGTGQRGDVTARLTDLYAEAVAEATGG